MKQIYLDVMETALSAYTDNGILEYMDKVKREGLTEHGFPRLSANIGILIAHGRRTDLKDTFIRMMDLCCDGFPTATDKTKAGNNFSIREVCHALTELEKSDFIEKSRLALWKEKLAALDPWKVYSHIVSADEPHPANWACFAILSEQARALYCQLDATEFIEHQLPSQLDRIDENGMYKDKGFEEAQHHPMLYDLITRALLGFTRFFGYEGKYASQIDDLMERSDQLTLRMQSVTGELPFGGRSNQFLHNETVLASYFELRATLCAKKGDLKKAGIMKAAAEKATETVTSFLKRKPLSHVKNHFDPLQGLGCEKYAYFNKYMITVATNAYLAYLAADDSIPADRAPADPGGYVAETSAFFHKAFLNQGGYFLEIDCNADVHYDANGLGRVHKQNCDGKVCLSVPIPSADSRYKTESPNSHPLSICGVKYTENGCVISARDGIRRCFRGKEETESHVSAYFDCLFDNKLLFTEKYTVSHRGVDLEFCGADAILLPVFLFDGTVQTRREVSEGQILIKYNGSFCKYTFSGTPSLYGSFFNRNGRYLAYKIESERLRIEMGDINEL